MERNNTSIKAYKKEEWDNSYRNKDNFVFYPHEEIIRFVSKYFCKRVGFNKFHFKDYTKTYRGLDLGCGIGRHMKYLNEMGICAYGIDLSEEAINYSKEWFSAEKLPDIQSRLFQGSITDMPYDSNYFDLVVSHGVLDSMPFKIAYSGMKEAHRILQKNGLMYFDVISGDDKNRYKEYFAKELIDTEHEKGTIQTYYNWEKINELADIGFEIIEAYIIKKESVISNVNNSRYHIVLKKR